MNEFRKVGRRLKCSRCDGTGRIRVLPALSAKDFPSIHLAMCIDCGGEGWLSVQQEELIEVRQDHISKKSAIYCEHANEMPVKCPCDDDCYCKEHSCKGR